MSQNTSIEWTDTTWNPTKGCSRISPGCKNCYAEKIAGRFSNGRADSACKEAAGMENGGTFSGFAIMKNGEAHWTGKVELVESKLMEPLHWRKPQRVFVNSMSDLFHENLPYPDILHVFQTIGKCQRHTFQILTKREAKMRELLSLFWWRNLGYSPAMGGDHWVKVIAGEQRPGDQNFLPNVHLGVSIENQATADARIPQLLQTPAALRFISYEPALEGVDLSRYLQPHWTPQNGADAPPWLDWVIIGGESGPGARPFDLEWARHTIRQCKAAGVPVFVKQLGSNPVQTSSGGLQTRYPTKNKKGGDMEEWPEDLQGMREFPKAA